MHARCCKSHSAVRCWLLCAILLKRSADRCSGSAKVERAAIREVSGSLNTHKTTKYCKPLTVCHPREEKEECKRNQSIHPTSICICEQNETVQQIRPAFQQRLCRFLAGCSSGARASAFHCRAVSGMSLEHWRVQTRSIVSFLLGFLFTFPLIGPRRDACICKGERVCVPSDEWCAVNE